MNLSEEQENDWQSEDGFESTDDLSDCDDVDEPMNSEDSEVSEEEDVEPSTAVSQIIYGKDNLTEWHKNPQQIVNIPQSPFIGKVHPNLPTHSLKAVFEMFVTNQMLDTIVKATNEKGNNKYQQDWVDTDATELISWFGLHLRAGVNRDGFRPVPELFSMTDGPAIYGACMSRTRFTLIKECIRFDNAMTRAQRKSYDSEGKLAPIKEIFDLFMESCNVNYEIGKNVTIDEAIVPFRGRCSFKVFMPQKPNKHGIKIWSLCDSLNAYLSNAQIYCGKTSSTPERGQAQRVVNDLVEGIKGSWRNVTADNFFTSVGLCKELLQKNLTLLGTLRKNKSEIPPSFQASKERELYSTRFGFSKNERMVISSYVPKKRKAVIMLSSLHYSKDTDQTPPFKPNMIIDYNKSKSGVDSLDQVVKNYSCRRSSSRWPLQIFYWILDVAAYNASVCYMQENPTIFQGSQKRRKFLLQLSEELVLPQIKRRSQSEGYQKLHKDCRIKIQAFVPNPASVIPANVTGKRKRCSICPTRTGKKTSNTCTHCHISVCNEHANIVCNDCL